jgi:lipopolysaccharide/colanic/teichoic acid biosynthesis glycosyltransferase
MGMLTYRNGGKRAMDLLLVAMAAVLLIPLIAVLALLVRVTLGRPVFFRQKRPGRGGTLFTVCKFRTMTNARDAQGRLRSDEERLTLLGRFLRASSMDELPQFWNLVRGEMSLVGPRPLLVEYLSRYTPEQARRHDVRPGITGWAQVNGRNSIGWEDKFTLDVWYVDNLGLALDLRIIWMTVLRVLNRSGISRQGHATMPEFQGTRVEP